MLSCGYYTSVFGVVYLVNIPYIGKWSELSECLILQIVMLKDEEGKYVISSDDVFLVYSVRVLESVSELSVIEFSIECVFTPPDCQ